MLLFTMACPCCNSVANPGRASFLCQVAMIVGALLYAWWLVLNVRAVALPCIVLSVRGTEWQLLCGCMMLRVAASHLGVWSTATQLCLRWWQ